MPSSHTPILFGVLGLIAVGLTNCSYRLDPYSDLLVGSPATSSPVTPPGDATLTYLGTAGYLLEHGDTALVIDPYFSRSSLREVMFNAPMAPKISEIESALRLSAFPETVDGWLITHAHFDHLLDVPLLQERYGGIVVTSETGRHLCEASGTPASAICAVTPGDKPLLLGDARVWVHPAGHDRVLGQMPYPGTITEPLATPPARPRDWKLGLPLAFLIEIGGKRIYVESGGVPGLLPEVDGQEIDLAILGVAVGDSQGRYPDAVRALQADFVLPSHQDDFFRPLESGFHFGPTTNFPKILARHRVEELPGQLILMDFFHRWTLP